MIDVATRERDRYLARVAARLQGIDPAERDDLLDDLRDHLTEVEAESEDELEAVLGPPERYAAELLASAGLAADGRTRFQGLRAVWARDRERVERVMAHPEVVASVTGLRQARPAWWVVRGWLAVVVVDAVFGSNGARVVEVVPHVAGNVLLGMIAIVGAVLGSVWLGRRTAQRWAHRVSIAGNLVLVLLLVATSQMVSGAMHRAYYPQAESSAYEVWWPEGSLRSADGSVITNLHPYGPDGQPLERIRIYDQEGRPVEIVVDELDDGTSVVTSYELDDRGRPVPHAFPQRQVPRAGPDQQHVTPEPPTRVPPLNDADHGPEAGVEHEGEVSQELVPGQEAPVAETGSPEPADDPEGDGTADQGTGASGSYFDLKKSRGGSDRIWRF